MKIATGRRYRARVDGKYRADEDALWLWVVLLLELDDGRMLQPSNTDGFSLGVEYLRLKGDEPRAPAEAEVLRIVSEAIQETGARDRWEDFLLPALKAGAWPRFRRVCRAEHRIELSPQLKETLG